MDTQKLHDLIDKVIGKTGPLRTPAYWMRRVLNGIMGRIDEKAKEVKSEIDNELKGKLDKAISLTYQEFYEMHNNGLCKFGTLYHIKDYRPTISVLQGGVDIRDDVYTNLYIQYPERHLVVEKDLNGTFKRDRTEFSGYMYLKPKYTHSASGLFRVTYRLHDFDDNSRPYWIPSGVECFKTIHAKDGALEYRLSNGNAWQTSEGSMTTVNADFIDDLTGESVVVEKVDLNRNTAYIRERNGVTYVLPIVGGTFNTYGYITRVIDDTRMIDVCFDYVSMLYGISYSTAARNIKITGYPDKRLPRVAIPTSGSDKINDIIITNSTGISLCSNCSNNVITDCKDVSFTIAVHNSCFRDCDSLRLSEIHDSKFIRCNNISQLQGKDSHSIEYSYLMRVNHATVGDNINAFIEGVYGNESEVVNVIGVCSGVYTDLQNASSGYINAMGVFIDVDGNAYRHTYTGLRRVTPKTTTSAVIDEATGKTLDTLSPLYIDISNLSGSAITQEFYDSLSEAIDAGRPVVVGGDPNYTTQSAVVIRDTLEIGLIHLIMLVITDDVVTTVAYALRVNSTPMLTKQWHMVSAGEGLEIDEGGTIRCTLDTNPFIIVPNGVLPESGESGKIYLTPASIVGDQNVMLEYVWVNNAWEKFGEFATNIDLSEYSTTEQVQAMIDASITTVLNTEV